MSQGSPKYILDANVFIQAKRRFYGLDFCPGYWDALCWHQREGHVSSIKLVHEELAAGRDDLSGWVEERFGPGSFEEVSAPETTTAYVEILAWVMKQPQFTEVAKNEFQRVADGWLVAHALATNCTVVTLEEFNPDTKKRVLIPNICNEFRVECINPFEMIRRLGITLWWTPQR